MHSTYVDPTLWGGSLSATRTALENGESTMVVANAGSASVGCIAEGGEICGDNNSVSLQSFFSSSDSISDSTTSSFVALLATHAPRVPRHSSADTPDQLSLFDSSQEYLFAQQKTLKGNHQTSGLRTSQSKISSTGFIKKLPTQRFKTQNNSSSRTAQQHSHTFARKSNQHWSLDNATLSNNSSSRQQIDSRDYNQRYSRANSSIKQLYGQSQQRYTLCNSIVASDSSYLFQRSQQQQQQQHYNDDNDNCSGKACYKEYSAAFYHQQENFKTGALLCQPAY